MIDLWNSYYNGAGDMFYAWEMIKCQTQKLGIEYQNSEFKIDAKGTGLLPTMKHSYDITGHTTRGES